MTKRYDITGRKFNKLTAISFSYHCASSNASKWLFECECGNQKIISASNVRTGHTKSCGCLNAAMAAARKTTHGKSKTKAYQAWINIKRRCLDKNITVCDYWVVSFENFLDDMGKPPTKSHFIGRIDNDLGYSKENCRWTLKAKNLRNDRT